MVGYFLPVSELECARFLVQQALKRQKGPKITELRSVDGLQFGQ
jgi:hypothetical protein